MKAPRHTDAEDLWDGSARGFTRSRSARKARARPPRSTCVPASLLLLPPQVEWILKRRADVPREAADHLWHMRKRAWCCEADAEFLRCAHEQTSDLRLLRLRKMMEPLGEKRKCLSGRGQEALPCPRLLGDRKIQVLLKTFDLPGTGRSPALSRGQDGAFRRFQLTKTSPGAVACPDELRLRPTRWRPGRGVRPHRLSEGC